MNFVASCFYSKEFGFCCDLANGEGTNEPTKYCSSYYTLHPSLRKTKMTDLTAEAAISPSDDILLPALASLREDHPDKGVLKLLAQLKVDHPEWAASSP